MGASQSSNSNTAAVSAAPASGSASSIATPATAAAPAAGEAPKAKKICCACPDTKKVRDECVLMKGEAACKVAIDTHNACLRKEGFDV